MPKEKILVVDDEEDILRLVEYNLSKEGFRVTCVTSGEEALRSARHDRPDLVLLDLMLPGVDGLEVCKALKADSRTRAITVMIVSARGEDGDIVSGLELGADDYIVKPFSPAVLRARVRSALRRTRHSPAKEDGVLKRESLYLDSARHEASLDGEELILTASEFKTLQFLASTPGRVFTRHQIVQAVHGDNYPVTDRSVDVQIVGLRKKLGNCGEYIETVRGIGYRFRE